MLQICNTIPPCGGWGNVPQKKLQGGNKHSSKVISTFHFVKSHGERGFLNTFYIVINVFSENKIFDMQLNKISRTNDNGDGRVPPWKCVWNVHGGLFGCKRSVKITYFRGWRLEFALKSSNSSFVRWKCIIYWMLSALAADRRGSEISATIALFLIFIYFSDTSTECKKGFITFSFEYIGQ